MCGRATRWSRGLLADLSVAGFVDPVFACFGDSEDIIQDYRKPRGEPSKNFQVRGAGLQGSRVEDRARHGFRVEKFRVLALALNAAGRIAHLLPRHRRGPNFDVLNLAGAAVATNLELRQVEPRPGVTRSKDQGAV